jgi:hypothetical protein
MEGDQPYICFYDKQMAPPTFAGLTANAFGDLIGKLFQLFVDDGGLAGDNARRHTLTPTAGVRQRPLTVSSQITILHDRGNVCKRTWGP